MVLAAARRYLPRMSTAKELVRTRRRVFVTADTHFGHEQAPEIFRRPFASASDMDDALIASINEVVGAKDELVHLGDFAGPWGKRPDEWDADDFRRLEALRDRIVCRRIRLVCGNHDPAGRKRFDRLFESVDEIVSARGIAGVDERIVLFHYPIQQWQGRPNGGFHLHGHVHGHAETLARRYDAGVDAAPNALRPRLLTEVVAELRATPPSGFVRV